MDFRTFYRRENETNSFCNTRIWCLFPQNGRWSAYRVPNAGQSVFITGTVAGYFRPGSLAKNTNELHVALTIDGYTALPKSSDPGRPSVGGPSNEASEAAQQLRSKRMAETMRSVPDSRSSSKTQKTDNYGGPSHSVLQDTT